MTFATILAVPTEKGMALLEPGPCGYRPPTYAEYGEPPTPERAAAGTWRRWLPTDVPFGDQRPAALVLVHAGRTLLQGCDPLERMLATKVGLKFSVGYRHLWARLWEVTDWELKKEPEYERLRELLIKNGDPDVYEAWRLAMAGRQYSFVREVVFLDEDEVVVQP